MPKSELLSLVVIDPLTEVQTVQINVGHLLIDLHLPSFRYFVTSANGATGHILNWDFGAGFGYAF